MKDLPSPQHQCSEGTQIVEEMMSTGLIAIDAYNNRGLTPLHVAVQNQKYLLARSLIQNGANINAKSKNGDDSKTALGMAIVSLLPNMVKLLLDHQADLNEVCTPYESALWSIITNEPIELRDQVKHKAIRDLIFQHGLKTTDKSLVDYYELCKAVVDNDLKSTKRLINSLEDVSFDEVSIESPLDFAVQLNHSKIVELLLERGVSKLDCEIAFFRAIDEERVKIVELFLKSKIDVNSLTSSWSKNCKETALYRAVEQKNLKVINLLLDFGAEVQSFSNYDDECCETALHGACRFGFSEVVKLLLKRGAEVNLKNTEGQTPLHLACADASDLKLLKTLVQHGAQVSLLDKYDWSILHYVGNNLELSVVKYVINLALESGIDINEKSKNGHTAIDCVICDNLLEFLKIGADLNIRSGDGEYQRHECYDQEGDFMCPAIEYIGRLCYLGYKVRHPDIQDTYISGRSLQLYHQELEKLKNQIIAWNPRTTLYDVLFMSRSNLVRFSRNNNLREAFSKCKNDFESSYPYFGSVLNIQCRRGINRYKLISFAQSNLPKIIGKAVPEICCSIIFKYLENSHLKKFDLLRD